jgi:hypothetical protein
MLEVSIQNQLRVTELSLTCSFLFVLKCYFVLRGLKIRNTNISKCEERLMDMVCF